MDLNESLAEGLTGTLKKEDERKVLTQAAFEQRKLDLDEAFGKGQKDGRRMQMVVNLRRMAEVFGDSIPIHTPEYVAYRDKALSELPPEAGDPAFTLEAHKIFMRLPYEVKCELEREFAGQYNVDEKTLLMEVAKIRCERDPRKPFIDCVEPVKCANTVCGKLFIPLAWDFVIIGKNGPVDIRTGHWLAVDGSTLALCNQCRNAALDQAKSQGEKLYFYCEEDAQERAKRQADAIAYEERQENREKRKRERSEGHRAERQKGVEAIVDSVFKPRLQRGENAKNRTVFGKPK